VDDEMESGMSAGIRTKVAKADRKSDLPVKSRRANAGLAGQAKAKAEIAELFDKFDREIVLVEARADRLLEMYGLR
jgi:hypothetical protein